MKEEAEILYSLFMSCFSYILWLFSPALPSFGTRGWVVFFFRDYAITNVGERERERESSAEGDGRPFSFFRDYAIINVGERAQLR